jgi:hypothetical protein
VALFSSPREGEQRRARRRDARSKRLAKGEVFASTIGRLQQILGEVVDTLCEGKTDKQQGATKVGAASAMLDHAVGVTEHVVEHMEELEERERNR